MSDLEQGHSDTGDTSVFSDEVTENVEDYSSDSSDIPSPTDDESTDPNYVCNVIQDENPTSISTRGTRRNSTGTIPTHSPVPPRKCNLFLTVAENSAAHANSTAGASQTTTTATANKSKAKAAQKESKYGC